VGIVYRPNEAKVKNLKTKDYLGKPRLVAASDRSNAFTGFAGAEIKRMNTSQTTSSSKDDRPEEKLSYAATNLVKPNLQSRSRQQSEPPINRNLFPPTPPPEAETKGRRISGDSNSTGQMTRAQSVRGGGPKPLPLDLGRAAFDQSEKPRLGTQRSASERPRPSRQESLSSRRGESGRRERDAARRRVLSDEEGDDYPDELYDVYQQPRSNRPSFQRSRSTKPQRPMYIDEEEEDDYEQSSIDEAEFEIVSRSKTSRRSPARRGTSRRPDIRTIRVKVHAEDTRYVFLDPNKSFREFSIQIREKFGLRQNFKIKIKDDDDMITMADQDDLEMAIQTSKMNARRERAEMGKMEVSYPHPFPPLYPCVAPVPLSRDKANAPFSRSGSKKYRVAIPRHYTPISVSHEMLSVKKTRCLGWVA
jgi:hypothetical protein